jgi:hypothetical protein
VLIDFDSTSSNSRAPKNVKSVKGLVAMAIVGAVAVLGSTLAANISLNSGSLEFGQGVAITSACDPDGITATPKAIFANSSGAGQYNFASVSLSGIHNGCANDLFTINAYGDTSAVPLNIATSGATTYNVATFLYVATLPGSSYISTGSYVAPGSNTGTAEIGFRGTQATAGAVFKITLQTSN